MSGTVETMSLDDVRSSTASDQSRLSSFGTSQTTYIGIVNSTTDEFEAAIDEWDSRLAPPDNLFYHWLNTRKELESQGMRRVRAHHEAIEEVNYEDRFQNYLRRNDEAHDAIDEIVRRVESGEHIVLVCFCGEGKWCHRTMVYDEIERSLPEDVQ